MSRCMMSHVKLGNSVELRKQYYFQSAVMRYSGQIKKEVKSNITDNVPQGIFSGFAIHLKSAKMITSKGTIQGCNGIATVNKKHQIIVDAQACGEGQEHHTLQPVLKSVFTRFKRLGITLESLPHEVLWVRSHHHRRYGLRQRGEHEISTRKQHQCVHTR